MLVGPLVLVAVLVAGGCSSAAPAARLDASTGATSPSSTAGAAVAAEVSVVEAAAMRDAGAFVLDVREPDEWATGHIPGAMLIPLGTLESRLDELPADRDIVVVCRSGNRSARGRDILRANGIPRSTSMAGGMDDWTASGMPIESGG